MTGPDCVAAAYATLGLLYGASRRQVNASHKALSLQFHPDTGRGDDSRQKEINAARDVLLEFLTDRGVDERVQPPTVPPSTMRSSPHDEASPDSRDWGVDTAPPPGDHGWGEPPPSPGQDGWGEGEAPLTPPTYHHWPSPPSPPPGQPADWYVRRRGRRRRRRRSAIAVIVLAAGGFGLAYALLRTDVDPSRPLPSSTLVQLLDIGPGKEGTTTLQLLPAANDALRNAALLISGVLAVGILVAGLLVRSRHPWATIPVVLVVMVMSVGAPVTSVERAYEAMADDEVTRGLYCTTFPAPTSEPQAQRVALCNVPNLAPTQDGNAPTSVNLASYRVDPAGPSAMFDRVVPLLGASIGSTSAHVSGVRLNYGNGSIAIFDRGGVSVLDLSGELTWQRPVDPTSFDADQSGGPTVIADLATSLVGPSVVGLDPAATVIFLNCEHDSSFHEVGEPESYVILDVRDGQQLNSATCP